MIVDPRHQSNRIPILILEPDHSLKLENIFIRVSQITNFLREKNILETCTLYYIMPFAKIIGLVKKFD